jgi:uncharacterized membrane protein
MTNYAVFGLEVIVIIIIVVIVAAKLVEVFRISISTLMKKEEHGSKCIRDMVLRMLRGLLISLDFLVAADILKTILVHHCLSLPHLQLLQL